jgi:hypothetical protein
MASVNRFHKTGGPEVLQIDEVDVGAPERGELRLPITKEKMSPPNNVGHQNPTAYLGTFCQIESRLIQMIPFAGVVTFGPCRALPLAIILHDDQNQLRRLPLPS